MIIPVNFKIYSGRMGDGGWTGGEGDLNRADRRAGKLEAKKRKSPVREWASQHASMLVVNWSPPQREKLTPFLLW